MAYYDALVTAWNNATQPPPGITGTGLTGGMTTAQKLAAVNGWTVAGPNRDVLVTSVVSYLSLRGLLTGIEDWLLQVAPPPNVPANLVMARVAPKELLRVFNMPQITTFQMSDAVVYAQIKALLDALAANPPALLSAQNEADLLALASAAIPWWQATITQGGAGLNSPVSMNDLAAAGGLA
jgi:hypothetical protein